MKTADGSFHYAYYAQAIVDQDRQVIVATTLTNIVVVVEQNGSLNEKLRNTVDVLPGQVLADAGCCSATNLDYAKALHTDTGGTTESFIATKRIRHGERVPEVPRGRIPANATLRERMARKLKTKKGRLVCARHKAIVGPVFGQTDEAIQHAITSHPDRGKRPDAPAGYLKHQPIAPGSWPIGGLGTLPLFPHGSRT